MVALARAARAAGAAGVVLTLRYLGFLPDIETGAPFLGTWAAVGGPWSLPLALRWVAKTHQAMPDLPIAGSNGAVDGEDAVRLVMSVATVGAVLHGGPGGGYEALTVAVEGLEAYCRRKGLAGRRELVGMAIRNALDYAEQRAEGPFAPLAHFPALRPNKSQER